MDRRVPTRWNSELDCVEAHIFFRPVIEAFTSPTENGLAAYRLTRTQWDLAEDVADVLMVRPLWRTSCISLCITLIICGQIFKKPTLLYSQANLPLICDVLQMIDTIETGLIKAHDNIDAPNVACVAAHSGLLLLRKYHSLTNECEIYCIAVGM